MPRSLPLPQLPFLRRLAHRPVTRALPLCALAAAALLCTATVQAQAVFVGAAGKAVPFSNLQDSIALNYYLPTDGLFPREGEAFGYTLGMARISAGATTPFGLAADGRQFSVAANSAQYVVMGTVFGGNGTNFNVPNLVSRTVVGAYQGNGNGPTADLSWELGLQRGTATITLQAANLPTHVHRVPAQYPLTTPTFTQPSGVGLPFNNVQPSLGLSFAIVTSGDYPSSGVVSDTGMTLGMVLPYTGNRPLSGGLMAADGRLLPIQGNDALFSVLGTTYGGNGTTNFALPDLRGRTVVGAGERPGAKFGATLGQTFGGNMHVLTLNEMPLHSHNADPTGAVYAEPAGGSGVFDNTQPSLALNYLISTKGPVATGTDQDKNFADVTFAGDIIAFAGASPAYLPGGFLLADGRSLKISDFPTLFSVIGYTYGLPVSQGTFRLPDLRGRTVIGAGRGLGVVQTGLPSLQSAQASADDGETLDTYALGDTPGDTLPELTVDNLAIHAPEVSAVPEPASGLLAAVGGLVVALRLRRQRRQPANLA